MIHFCKIFTTEKNLENLGIDNEPEAFNSVGIILENIYYFFEDTIGEYATTCTIVIYPGEDNRIVIDTKYEEFKTIMKTIHQSK